MIQFWMNLLESINPNIAQQSSSSSSSGMRLDIVRGSSNTTRPCCTSSSSGTRKSASKSTDMHHHPAGSCFFCWAHHHETTSQHRSSHSFRQPSSSSSSGSGSIKVGGLGFLSCTILAALLLVASSGCGCQDVVVVDAFALSASYHPHRPQYFYHPKDDELPPRVFFRLGMASSLSAEDQDHDNDHDKDHDNGDGGWALLRKAMAAEGSIGNDADSSTRMILILNHHLERTGLTDIQTLILLAQDFVERPEVFSSLLISDFSFPPLVAHQTRAVVMRMIIQQQQEKQQQQQQQQKQQQQHNQTSRVRTDRLVLDPDPDDPSLDAWEAPVGSFPTTTTPMAPAKKDIIQGSADNNNNNNNNNNHYYHPDENSKGEESSSPPILFSGYKDEVVNDKASQRRRKAKATTDAATTSRSTKHEDQDDKAATQPSSSSSSSSSSSLSYEYGLPADYETVYPTLALELQAFDKFMTQPSTQSQEDPIRPATANVYLRHAKLFLGWYVHSHQHRQHHQHQHQSDNTASLSIYSIIPSKEKESAQTLIEFVMWLRSERQVSAAYEANFLRGLLKLLKFRFAQESETDSTYGGNTFTDIPLIKEIRKLHRTANQKQRVAPKSSDEQKKWLSWPEYLQVIEKTKDETLQLIQRYQDLITDNKSERRRYRKEDTERLYSLEEEEIASAFQKYLILAIFASIPDRQRTIRELEIGRTLVKDKENASNGQYCYYIKHGPEDYKTGKSYGERPPLQLAPELTPALDDFIERWRPALRPSTNFLFVQTRTGKPLTQDSVFARVTRSCFKYTGKRTNPHLLRSMIITHVREESNASEKELEALALFMGHSIQMQRSSYDKRTLKNKIAPAVQLMQNVNNNNNNKSPKQSTPRSLVE